MSTTTMMTPRELAQKLGTECLEAFPVIVLGSGASAAHGIPAMGPLREELVKSHLPAGLSPEDQATWQKFLDAAATKDLESALNDVRLSDVLTKHVVETTWKFLAPTDLSIYFRVIADRKFISISRLFKYMSLGIQKNINVVTTNYDCIPEYAANAINIDYFTGFTHGYIGNATEGNVKTLIDNTQRRCVKIWKVHGSLDWFRDPDGIAVSLPIAKAIPSKFTPQIVTPGIEKYRLTRNEPFRSIQTESDKALKAARSYLCIGFGFNDEHIQQKLVEHCREPNVILVILTKDLTDNICNFLKSGHCKNYLVLTNSEGAPLPTTRMYSPDYPLPDGVDIPGETYWSLDGFLDHVT